MVTGDQELQWAYLLCPTFELSNSEGKPLTNGYIELYIAGTRDKYYAASDFAGTLHPFQIPLDSLGSNIVLVSPDNAYDIYVYNRFGNLVMSRYNVVPTNGAAGGGSSSSNISIESGDGTVVVTESTDPETGVKTFDLSVPSVSGNPSFWTGRGAATMGVTISDTEYHKLDISNHSLRNRNDDITVVDGEFNLKKGVYFWNVTVQLDKYDGHDNTRQRVFIESGYNRGAYTMDMTHDETETISFSGITVADYDDTKQDIKIKSEGESPFKAVLYNVSIHKLNQNILGDSSGGHTYLPGDYIEITEDDVINVTGLTTPEDVEAMIDAAITALASGDIYTAGDYINIDNHVISVTGLQPEGDYLTQEDLEGYATETYVDNSVSSFVTNTEVYDATVTAIEHVTALIPEAQVQSNWTEADNTDPSYIQNKPEEVRLVAGNNVNITETATSIVISASGGGPEYTAGANIYIDNNEIGVNDVIHIDSRNEAPEGYILLGNIVHWGHDDYGPGIMIEATMDDYMDNRGYVWYNTSDQGRDERFWGQYDYDREAMSVSGESCLSIHEGDIQYRRGDFDWTDNLPVIWSCSGMRYDIDRLQEAVTAIPAAQVQSNWNETDTSSPAYILNKPNLNLYATDTEVYNAVVTGIQVATGVIPDSEEVEFEEINLEDYALASAVPTIELNNSDQVTAIDGHTLAAAGGGSTYTAGQYISIDSNDVIAVTGLAPVSGSDGIAVNNNVVSLDIPVEIIPGDNITISVTGASAIISAQGGSSTYSAGNGIDITNDVISIDNTIALKTDIPVVTGFATVSQVSGKQNMLTGITDVQVVTGLPVSPTQDVLYLIVEA